MSRSRGARGRGALSRRCFDRHDARDSGPARGLAAAAVAWPCSGPPTRRERRAARRHRGAGAILHGHMRGAFRFTLAVAASCSTSALACWSGFGLSDQAPPAGGTPVGPPNICDAGADAACCGNIACTEACCLVGGQFECFADAASCTGIPFYGTECISDNDCKGVGECCLEGYFGPGSTSVAITTCEQTSFFECGLFAFNVCTGEDAAACDNFRTCRPLASGAPISACF
jgi:hypothetical protein